MGFVQTVGPAAEPVLLSELKTQLGIFGTDDDARVRAAGIAARQATEAFCNRSLISQTWLLSLPRFVNPIRLGKAPVQSVTQIEYIDGDGNSQTWADTEYDVDTSNEPGYVRLAHDKQFPSSVRGVYNTVQVTYVTGYGDEAEDVPEALRVAIKLRAQYDFLPEESDTLLKAWMNLCRPYQLFEFES